jgi:hypothetical protein
MERTSVKVTVGEQDELHDTMDCAIGIYDNLCDVAKECDNQTLKLALTHIANNLHQHIEKIAGKWNMLFLTTK